MKEIDHNPRERRPYKGEVLFVTICLGLISFFVIPWFTSLQYEMPWWLFVILCWVVIGIVLLLARLMDKKGWG